MARTKGARGNAKARRIKDIIEAVGAGVPAQVETVDFGDPLRPKTCLEVDFPIIPVNHVATIEGNAGKPIYQMSKWFARRRSSVFRSLLLSAAMKAPADSGRADKVVWDAYYANHQKNPALERLKVADIFMGGGTTVVEAARLGMQVFGTDLNPVAWFVVKNELSGAQPSAVQALLDDIEAEVKPQIMPFYACDCPRGHKGKWTRIDGMGKDVEAMGPTFDPLSIAPVERRHYRYQGPEIIYVFWAKHGPCQVMGCGHRTPIFTTPVVAVKTLTVKAWPDIECPACKLCFDVEAKDARMAPGVPLVVAADQKPHVVIQIDRKVRCPGCSSDVEVGSLSGRKMIQKRVALSLLVHPDWIIGLPANDKEYGGSATDAPQATAAWNAERASKLQLLEVRGVLPETVTCPETGSTLATGANGATLGAQGIFKCGGCGKGGGKGDKDQKLVEALEKSGKTAAVAAFALQGYCPACETAQEPYRGRFFAMARSNTEALNSVTSEWETRKKTDLAAYWPTCEIPFGHMTHQRQPLPQHGYTHYWKMFHPRQLLVHARLLRAIVDAGERHSWETREFVLGAFQQYLRNQNMFCFWNPQGDKLEPLFSSNNFHPKATLVENCVFSALGRGNWKSCTESLLETLSWASDPWEVINIEHVRESHPHVNGASTTKSEKIACGDPVLSDRANIACVSATDVSGIEVASHDLVITDPPFSGLLHYAELADFFYVWLRLVLKDRYPDLFTAEYTPKVLEAVSSPARAPEDPDGFYRRLLTQCWREASRILKPGGILAFTFHHKEDDPWIDVLESLFEAGFYLEATYPIRSDETKGEGEFGSKKIEYDIVHVCRKRTGEPEPVSWGRLRRTILDDVRQLQDVLEHHAKEGLPAADLQVIRRGKALEHFSRHYGKVFLDEGRPISVRDALVGIHQLLDEQGAGTGDAPPLEAEPLTRQILRIFSGRSELPRDQIQKFLRGTGIAPQEFVERGWCRERKRLFQLVEPLDLARSWVEKLHRTRVSDYDQALFCVGACHEGSGIDLGAVLADPRFHPHESLGPLLEWHAHRGATETIRDAAARALTIWKSRRPHEKEKIVQATFTFNIEGAQ
jgi:SAM-dependent methyltransferase